MNSMQARHRVRCSRVSAIALAMAGLAVLGCANAWAFEGDLKGVGDPTRPPPGVILGPKGEGEGREGGGPARVMPGASEPDPGAAAPATEPVLAVSAIRIDLRSGEGSATIGDDLVHVGDLVRGMRVVAIHEDEVRLKGPDGERKLVLPDVIKQSRAPARAAKRGRKEKR